MYWNQLLLLLPLENENYEYCTVWGFRHYIELNLSSIAVIVGALNTEIWLLFTSRLMKLLFNTTVCKPPLFIHVLLQPS